MLPDATSTLSTSSEVLSFQSEVNNDEHDSVIAASDKAETLRPS